MAAILECHIAKQQYSFDHAKITVTQSWYDSIEIFSVSLLLFLVMEAILTGVFSNLKQLEAKIVLTQIWSKSIQWLLRYCQCHVLHYF